MGEEKRETQLTPVYPLVTAEQREPYVLSVSRRLRGKRGSRYISDEDDLIRELYQSGMMIEEVKKHDRTKR